MLVKLRSLCLNAPVDRCPNQKCKWCLLFNNNICIVHCNLMWIFTFSRKLSQNFFEDKFNK